MVGVLLTAALLPLPNPPEVRVIEVDLLETNTVRQVDGTERFTQIVAWDEELDDDGNRCAVDRGYKVVKEGYPCVHQFGDHFRVVWWCGPEKVYVLRSREHIRTETGADPEAKFREHGGWFRPTW